MKIVVQKPLLLGRRKGVRGVELCYKKYCQSTCQRMCFFVKDPTCFRRPPGIPSRSMNRSIHMFSCNPWWWWSAKTFRIFY